MRREALSTSGRSSRLASMLKQTEEDHTPPRVMAFPSSAQSLSTEGKLHTSLELQRESRNNGDDDDYLGEDVNGDLDELPAKLCKLEEHGTEKAMKYRHVPGIQSQWSVWNIADKERLCLWATQDRVEECPFGQKCRFQHDIKEYMATKSPDLGNSCVLFQTFGKCIYGVTCRFARAHLGEDFKNIVNVDLWKQWEEKPVVKNTFSTYFFKHVRNKCFPFDKSSAFLHPLAKSVSQAAVTSMGGAGNADCSASRGSMAFNTGGEKPLDVSRLSQKDGSTLEALGSPRQPVEPALKTSGAVTDEDIVRLRPCEKRKLDLHGKLYVSSLQPVGNLPFRRICKQYGADITCAKMVVAMGLLKGQKNPWQFLLRHHTEDLFGVQLLGGTPDSMIKCADILNQHVEMDFVEINADSTLKSNFRKGEGCALMNRTNDLEQIVRGMDYVLDVPVAVKIRNGVETQTKLAHKVIPSLRDWGASFVTLHGRSAEQQYSTVADWDYIVECAKIASPMPLLGNGDIFSFEDANRAIESGVSGMMIARAALIKPWIFTEIKEQRNWDISSSERLDMLRDFVKYGLEFWGSDTQGIESVRQSLLEWFPFLCRYIPVGTLEHLPPRIGDQRPSYVWGDYLENLMASEEEKDWIKISEMLLGPVPDNFCFQSNLNVDHYVGLE